LRHGYEKAERDLIRELHTKQEAIVAALCDNINTPLVVTLLLDLVSKTNIYIRAGGQHQRVLERIGLYVQEILIAFGMIPNTTQTEIVGIPTATTGDESTAKKEDLLWPYMQALSGFREQIRIMAKQNASPADYLRACDVLRDDTLPPLGVSLEDTTDQGQVIKFLPAEILMKQRQEKQEREAARVAALEASRRAEAEKRLEKLRKGRVAPGDMFRTPEFTSWDETGIPLTDKDGEVAKSRRKKMAKEQSVQGKLHQEYLLAKQRGEVE
jgi:cysteinyl-tRNA synthetase